MHKKHFYESQNLTLTIAGNATHTDTISNDNYEKEGLICLTLMEIK